jgi:[histone H3]-N6,N6-dimethyl-lysine9 N-methyltransferase
MFVQCVFVDSHDLRFPWLALFAARGIKAGEELVWDYGYSLGSSETKVLLCKCGAKNCVGRLL